MEPRDWPLDPVAAEAAVVRAIEDVDRGSEDERDALLYELVRTAWGTVWAQDQ
ncbi:MAG TPA: hypothetical protein VK790_14835 [Solirubrobacteraceae bacterium]|jgi:hypothetical protein|nr:hypothetical protein [Solirubrobacteraceae bacterium]